jgi:hypothetical protein
MAQIENYREPDYSNIIKREYFDEDNMKYLLLDNDFNKQDRLFLSNYNKHRVSGSLVNVSYKFAEGCEELKLGRLYAQDSMSLQQMRFDLRNPLAKKYYWDIDVENCHYIIAYNFCIKNNLKCDEIKKYIDNREEYLTKVSSNRKMAKTEFLKLLYGGNIKLYNDYYNDINDNMTDEGYKILNEIKKEIDNLMNIVWINNDKLHKFKISKDKKQIIKKPNPKASLMSLLFQTEERKILMCLDTFLKQNGREISVFIHDGGLILKKDGETRFPQDLLNNAMEYINKNIGYNIKLTQKDIKYEWTPKNENESKYDIMKKEFEEHTFMVGSTFYHYQPDGVLDIFKLSDLKTKFSNLTITKYNEEKGKMESKKFVDLWMNDANRLSYERADFFPDINKCPPYVFNLFKGFNAEKFKCDLTEDEINELIQPIYNHLNIITSGNADFVMKWLANIIQYPDIKSEMSIVLRDMGGYLYEGGGTGKNTFIDWFLSEILGKDLYSVVNNNDELYSPFNGIYEGKLLVFVEEASSMSNHRNNDYMKSKITAKEVQINKKGINQYSVRDYCRYLFCSNNKNPIALKQGDRRFFICDSDTCKRGDFEYFNNLYSHLYNNKVKYAFYKYLQTCYTYNCPNQFKKNLPITLVYIELRYLNSPLYIKWIISNLKNGTLRDDIVSNLYINYTKWVEQNRERSIDGIGTLTAFGKMLIECECQSNNNDFKLCNQGNKKKDKNGNMFMKWDIDSVVQNLQKLYILDNDFVYNPVEINKEDI